MKQRAASPDVLVDLGKLDEFRTISVSGTTLEIGAMATLTSIIGSSEVEVSRPILAEVAATVADVQVRNRGTLGGNICVNDPTNHFPPLLVALGASMAIRNAGGERTVDAHEFFVGVFETAVGEGEPPHPDQHPGRGQGHRGRNGRRDARSARDLRRECGGVADGAWRVALGCVAAVLVRATAVEEKLSGVDVDDASARAAVEASVRRSTRRPTSTRRSEYRRSLAETSTVRAVLEAAERAKG